MASVKLKFYTHKTYQDGTHPVVIQIIHKRKIKRISTGVNLFDFEWDFKKNEPMEGIKNYKEVIRLIRSKLSDAEKLNLNFETQKKNFNADELAGNLKAPKNSKTFLSYSEELIAGFMKANKIGNAEAYRCAISAVKNFTKKKDLDFTEIDYKFLKKFEEHHLSKETNTINGFNAYLRSIRAIYNRAIKEGLVSIESYPFRDYKIKQKKTAKVAISAEEIEKIIALDLIPESAIWHTRNFFLFSFFTIGMSWADFTQLKINNIKGDRILYKRSKTGKDYSIKINSRIKEILRYYTAEKSNNDYIFPIITRDKNPEERRKDIRNHIRHYNKRLRKIGEMINSSITMRSYVSRHSWASISNFKGTPIGIISQGLGHNDIKTTQTYLADFDNSAIDDANENIL